MISDCVSRGSANSTASHVEDLSLNNALGLICKHVEGIVNPFLADLLLDRLDVKKKSPADLSKGIEWIFEGVALPKETIAVIRTASLVFAKMSTTNQEKVEKDLAALVECMRHHRAHQMARKADANKVHAELEILLKAPAVLALDQHEASLLLEHVKEDTPEHFKAWVYSLIQSGKLDGKALEAYSQEMFHQPFLTLIKQVIKKKPSVNSLPSGNGEDSTRINEQTFLQLQRTLVEIENFILQDINLFNALVKELVSSRFKKIHYEILMSPHVAIVDKIKEVVHAKHAAFGTIVTVEEVLIEVIGVAAFRRLIPGERNFLIENTMGLLAGTTPYVEQFTGKEGVFFFGSTDAGKSTSINFFLGAKMKKIENSVGDTCFISEEDNANFPKIGTAIGTSETLYAKAYLLNPNEERVLIDCPGFNDTRGEHYRLCTNVSIDLAVQQIGKIKAVVIVLPIAEFIQDRGNHIVKILKAIKERFEGLLDPGQTDRFPFVHILLTKITHVSSLITQAVREGRVFAENLSEIREEIGKYMNHSEGDMRLKQLQEALAMWKTLQQLHLSNRIRMIDLEDDVEKEELLFQYFKEGEGVPKQCYQSFMENPSLWEEFGEEILSITKNWVDMILRPYLEGIPAEINQLLVEKERLQVEKVKYEKPMEASKLRHIQQVSKLQLHIEQVSLLKEKIERSKRDQKKILDTLAMKLKNEEEHLKNLQSCRKSLIKKRKREKKEGMMLDFSFAFSLNESEWKIDAAKSSKEQTIAERDKVATDPAHQDLLTQLEISLQVNFDLQSSIKKEEDVLKDYLKHIENITLQELALEDHIKALNEKRCHLAVVLKMQSKSLQNLKDFIQLSMKSMEIRLHKRQNNETDKLFQQFLEMSCGIEHHQFDFTPLRLPRTGLAHSACTIL